MAVASETNRRLTLPMLLFLWGAVTMLWWAMAFWPSSAGWVPQMQAICFGIAKSGLPEPYGWVNLIGAPILLLAFMLITWGSEIGDLGRFFFGGWSGRIVLVLMLLSATSEALWVKNRIHEEMARQWRAPTFDRDEHLPENYPRLNREAFAFQLVNQEGKATDLKDLRGKDIVLTFAFAHCHTVCPMVVRNVLDAHKEFSNGKTDLRTLIVTLDPWRDTPSTLPDLAKAWELPSGAYVLSGSIDAVTATLKGYNIPFDRNLKTGDVSHPPLVFLIDKEGRIAYQFNNPNPTWIGDAIGRL